METIEHYGYWSVLPPLIAVVLAMLTRRIILALFAGVFAACLILSSGNPLKAVIRCVSEDLFNSLFKVEHLQVFAFTLLVGGMVGVIHSSGGMRSLVLLLEPFASDRRRGQLFTWIAGLVIFFDDYANTLLLGTTFQPVTDRLKISREKLAYIVDSTAAPVAGLALISTWVAGEVNFIGTGLQQIDVHDSGGLAFFIFVKTILYRFYPLLALILVGIVAHSGKDFGPMWRAEKQALTKKKRPEQRDEKSIASRTAMPVNPLGSKDNRFFLALASIGVLVAVLVLSLLITGLLKTDKHSSWWEVVGAGDAYGSLVWASLAGCLTAAFLSWIGEIGTGLEIFIWAWRGFKMMSSALVVLWLAWTLADLTSPGGSGEQLGTSVYLASLLGDSISPAWLPTLVFLLASVVAYCTGTSWGTMSILVPLMIPLTWKILGGSGEEILHTPIFSASVGGVLAGSIFGDHCSPLSDTTILSSRASGCDHMAHVWTQAPYALLAAVVSVIAGTIPVGFGVPIGIVLPGAILLLWLAHHVLARKITTEETG
ncbi:MAG: Na+/H+ antiporter NhaC family protein [Pirellulales bacterium]|nr:Na+/H+ antiporter NhaC family protein [Pirellulales bacterium]